MQRKFFPFFVFFSTIRKEDGKIPFCGLVKWGEATWEQDICIPGIYKDEFGLNISLKRKGAVLDILFTIQFMLQTSRRIYSQTEKRNEMKSKDWTSAVEKVQLSFLAEWESDCAVSEDPGDPDCTSSPAPGDHHCG